ncbi:MAG: hypothetical protein ACKVOR_08120 [Flavobacteriales bacterium]
MNDKQESKLNMYDVVLSFMLSNIIKYTGMTPIEQALLKVKNGRDTILLKAGIQGGTTSKGATTDKADARLAFAIALMPLLDCAQGYALDLNDNDLASKFKTPRSMWTTKLKDGEVETMGLQVIADLIALGGAAVPYGVIAGDVTAAQTLLSEFISASTTPRERIVERSVATEELVPLFETTDTTLLKLDKLMGRFITTDNSFYLGYVGSRVIVDSGGGSTPTPPTPPTP